MQVESSTGPAGLSKPATGLSSGSAAVALRHELRNIDAIAAFRALRPMWQNFAASATDIPFCLTYEYCELAAEFALDRGDRVVVVLVHDDDTVQGIWPLAIQRKGLLRIADGLTCGSGEEYGGPAMRVSGSVPLILAAFRAVSQIDADVLKVTFATLGSPLDVALRSMPRPRLPRLLPQRIGMHEGYWADLRDFPRWTDFVGTLAKRWRSDMRRCLRNLQAVGHIEVGWCETPAEAESILRWLFANKRRWAQSRHLGATYLDEDRVKDFFIALTRRVDLSATPFVAALKVDGIPIAASVNLPGSRSVEGLITTFDTAYQRYAPGHLLVEFVAEWAHAHGRDFDFRPFASEFKARWANRRTQHRTSFVILTARGRLIEIPLFLNPILVSARVRLLRLADTARANVKSLRNKTFRRRPDACPPVDP